MPNSVAFRPKLRNVVLSTSLSMSRQRPMRYLYHRFSGSSSISRKTLTWALSQPRLSIRPRSFGRFFSGSPEI